MRDIKIILLLTFCSLFARAQSDSVLLKTASGKTLKRLGKSAMAQDDASSAIGFLEAYHKYDSLDAKASNLLAQAYMEIRDYDRAQRMFLIAYNTDKKAVPEALYYHAQMQKSTGKYDSAKLSFQRFTKEYKGSEKQLKKQARKEVVFCDSVARLTGNKKNIVMVNLDSTINKINSEGAPLSLDENTMIFSSLRTDKKEYVIEDDYSKVPKKKIYMARKQGEKWTYAGTYPNFNDEDANTGNVSFSADKKRAYFSKCRRNISGKMICAIYMSEKQGGTWSEPVKLPKEINHPRYTSTMPAVTTDPNKGYDMIYYVSNNRKGRGGMDIWYTIFDKKKQVYKDPKNAGSKINTPQDEITPFFDNETRTLYFSSDGLGGLGGFDIYQATGDGKKFTGAQNLGGPFNTGADDIYYTITERRDEGFFVSNRKGGAALPNSTCCDDIYNYKFPEYIHINVKGEVLDMVTGTLPVPDAKVDIYIKDPVTGDRYFVKSTKTDSAGKYTARLEPEKDYIMVIKKKDLLGVTEEISTRNMSSSGEISRSVKVARKPTNEVEIPDFNYEFGKSELNADQKKALDFLLVNMMMANPEIIVEIQSHTDSKGNELFNQKLSQKRAETIVNYVISRGIDPVRLKPVGYGEERPLVPNENKDGSDNPENRAKNRRTEFKIVGILDTDELTE